jgi:hypothetical protein
MPSYVNRIFPHGKSDTIVVAPAHPGRPRRAVAIATHTRVLLKKSG